MNPTPPGQPDPTHRPPAHPQGGYPPGGSQPWGDRSGGGQGGPQQGGFPQGGFPQGGFQQGGYPAGGQQQGGPQQGAHPAPGYPPAGPSQGGPGGWNPGSQGGPPQGRQPGFPPGGPQDGRRSESSGPGRPDQGGAPYGGYGPGSYPPAGPAGAPARPRAALPSLPVLAVLVVCLLALLNAIFGFLRSGVLERTGGGDPVPLGSVYAVAGWIPALLVVSGLAAAATRLKNVSAPTLWAVSAATAVTGGVGALFYLAAREGADAGLGFALTNGTSGELDSSVSAGLVLIVLFGLLQLVAALGGLLLTQSPQLARRAPGGSDAAHRYGPGAGQPPAPAAGAWGPPPGQPGGPDRGGFTAGPYSGQQPSAAGGPQGSGPDRPAPQSGPADHAAAAHPASGGIAPYGQYARTTAGEAPVPGGGAPTQSPAPSTYDPQAGRQVQSGLTAAPGAAPAPTSPTPWIPEPTPAQPGEVERALRPDPNPSVEYQRTEYGSSDFEWEPTYSEAPDYESRAGQGNGAEDDRDPAVHYETPEQRPAFAPPQLDSARHEGWDAGFAEDTLNGTGQPTSEQDRYRPIPRAE